jgi:hypothetical protein
LAQRNHTRKGIHPFGDYGFNLDLAVDKMTSQTGELSNTIFITGALAGGILGISLGPSPVQMINFGLLGAIAGIEVTVSIYLIWVAWKDH